jgi:hypothetical protein
MTLSVIEWRKNGIYYCEELTLLETPKQWLKREQPCLSTMD